jgi:hypothetical protein
MSQRVVMALAWLCVLGWGVLWLLVWWALGLSLWITVPLAFLSGVATLHAAELRTKQWDREKWRDLYAIIGALARKGPLPGLDLAEAAGLRRGYIYVRAAELERLGWIASRWSDTARPGGARVYYLAEGR